MNITIDPVVVERSLTAEIAQLVLAIHQLKAVNSALHQALEEATKLPETA